MNPNLSSKIIVVAAVVCAGFFYSFNSGFRSNAETVSKRAAQNVKISGKISRSADDAIINESSGKKTFVKFQNGRALKTGELADVAALQGIYLTAAQAVSAATDDFNGDGFPDLAVGCASSEGGFLLIYFGDEKAFAPTNQEVIRGIADNDDFPVPFKSVTIVKLPDAPDFLFAGDFDREGKRDILTAARGGQVMNLTANEGENFAPVRQIAVGGFISTVAAGRKNLSDDFADVFVGTSDGRVLIFEDRENLAAQTPLVQFLDVAAEQIAVGSLDEDGAVDLAIIAGGRLFISHGDDALLRKDGGYLDPRAGEIDAVELPFVVSSLMLGELVWDRDSRTEIGALSTDGAIRILTRGTLDTRPFTAAEISAKRQLLQEIRDGRRAADSVANRSKKIFGWVVDKEIVGGESSGFLLNARSSALPADDLVLLNAASRQIRILNQDNSVNFSAESEPLAAIQMRLNVMQSPGLVVLRKGQIEPTLVMLAPQVTFNVTTNSDVSDPTPDGTNNSGSLREAIQEANGTVAADLITFNAGISPTLTITGSDNAAATGDLDINESVTVMGNGSGSTIISSTYTTGCGDCKIFGVNQDGTHTTIATSITGVTVQNGFNDFSASCGGSFQETGGGLDFFLTGSNSYSISSSIFNNNRATGSVCAARHGGGINIDSAKDGTAAGTSAGTVTLTTVTVTNNIAQQDGGGIVMAADKHDVTATNPVITGNTAQNQSGGGIWIRHSFGGTIGISGVSGSVSNNTGTQGGGISNDGNQITNISDILVNNNTANGTGAGFSIGGGLAIFQLGALNVAGSTTLTSMTISNNHADNDAGGGGGVAFGRNYATTITNCNITGNTALQGNGGGVLNQGSASTPVNTLNISGGVIRGNSATGDGTNTGFGGAFAALGTGTSPPSSSTTTFSNVAIGGAGVGEGNSAVSGGAIANMNTSSTTVGGTSTIFGNTATTLGGGIFSGVIAPSSTASNTVTINNNVPIGGTTAGQGNSAANGGGVALNVGTINYTATSGNNIAGNSATTSGGGLFNNGGTANPSGLIITGNTATNGSAIHAALGTTTLSGTHTVSGNINIAGGTLIGATGSTTNLTGNFSESSGTFTGNNSTVNLTGNFSYTAGTFTAGTGTFNFNGAAAQSISNSSVITFNNLSDANVTQPLTFNNSLNVNGTLTANGSNTVLAPVAAAVIGGTGTLTGSGTARVTRTAATADFLSQYTITNKTLTNLLVDYTSAGAQVVNGISYGRISTSTGGTKTTSGAVNVGGNATVGGGTTLLVASGSTFSVAGTLTNSGTIQGLGTIVNNFSNAGILAPGLSPGILSVTGTFATPGSMNIEIGGTGGAGVNPNGHDQLLVSGAATIGGTLNVTLTNGFTPALGNSFLILDSASLTGTFATRNFPNVAPNAWGIVYDNAAGTILLRVVPATAASASITGRVLSQYGTAIPRARISIIGSGGERRDVLTGSFGYYRIDDVAVGASYIIDAAAKGYVFSPRVISVFNNVNGFDFVAESMP